MKPRAKTNPALDAGDRAFAQRARAALRASEQLDYVTAMRLQAVRRRALDRARRHRWPWLGPAGLIATALALAVWLPEQPGVAPLPSAVTTQLAHAELVEILLDENDPEFYEDLDFYRWLSEDAGGSV